MYDRVMIIIGFARTKFMMVKASRGEFPYRKRKNNQKTNQYKKVHVNI